MRGARVIHSWPADVVFANPCHFLQAPGALLHLSIPSLYFCDEPRALDSDPAVREKRNSHTRLLYAPLYAAERHLDRAAVLRADELVTNSASTAAKIETVYGRRATVLPMGVPDFFTPTFPEPRHLLSVGSLTPDKCHDLVLKAAAAARVTWPVLVVAPRPDPDAETTLKRLACELGVELTVRIQIPDTELVGAYREALATLYLAREEPYGLVSIEAQACGSPVIAAAEGGLPETLEDGVTGMLVERTAGAAAACIDGLSDPIRRDPIARAAAKRTSGASWARAAMELQALLEPLAHDES
jgi:glycosyltransferase involved in cell wall biosynthesis